jgi:hypothetical protein
MLGSFSVAAQLATSEEGLLAMKLLRSLNEALIELSKLKS